MAGGAGELESLQGMWGAGTPSRFSDPRSINLFCLHKLRSAPSQSTVTKWVGDTGAHVEGPVCAPATLLLHQTWGTMHEGKSTSLGSLLQSQPLTPMMTT